MAVAAQSIIGPHPLCELQHLQSAAQIDIQASFLRLSVQRGGDVQDRIGSVDQLSVLVIIQAELPQRDVAQKNLNVGIKAMLKAGEIEMKLQGSPVLELSRRQVF